MLILGEGLTLWLDLLLSYWEETFSNELSFSLKILLFHLLAIWIQGQSVTCFFQCDIYYKHSKCIWFGSEKHQVWFVWMLSYYRKSVLGNIFGIYNATYRILIKLWFWHIGAVYESKKKKKKKKSVHCIQFLYGYKHCICVFTYRMKPNVFLDGFKKVRIPFKILFT